MNESDTINWKAPLFIFLFVIAAWLISWYLLFNVENRGTFGDMFGAVNALFSGLAFGGVIYAILLQRIELKLQRNELELTREELSGQREELKIQNETMKIQRFENTFFQMLSLHNEILASIGLYDGKHKGRDAFKEFYRLMRNSELGNENNENIESVNKSYLMFYKKYESEIGHYFRNLYNVIKLIDRSPIADKKVYSNLVRAQLSSHE